MSLLDDYARKAASNKPDLKAKLKKARMDMSSEEYIKKALKSALMLSFGFAMMTFFFIARGETPKILVLFVFIVAFMLLKIFFMRSVEVKALKRAKGIDREVLFAGRFLLVKLHSGMPLLTALEQAASSYGVGSRFFKEIVDDIKLGTPVEEALEKAMDSSPSEKFSKILFQISNSLKIGVDVTDSLQAVLKEIAADQLIEIKKYGKKLSSMTMFYMLIAVVAPSLGITIVSVVLSLIGFPVDIYFYLAVVAGLAIVQFVFVVMFKSIRPNLDL